MRSPMAPRSPGIREHSRPMDFTCCSIHPIAASPTPEDLAVIYIPDGAEWERVTASMVAAAFTAVTSFDPYRDVRGRTFEDADGYRVVLQNAGWKNPA
jgi:hypothetical protein